MPTRSTRAHLRVFQKIHAGAPTHGFRADLAYLENRDLDLSVRLGALLAFNALLITIGTHPVSASPGAPLSVDAATVPWQTLASLVGILPFVAAASFVLRALMIGEEFVADVEEEADVLLRRLMSAYIRSIDGQTLLLRRAVWATVAGGAMTVMAWAWILAGKIG